MNINMAQDAHTATEEKWRQKETDLGIRNVTLSDWAFETSQALPEMFEVKGAFCVGLLLVYSFFYHCSFSHSLFVFFGYKVTTCSVKAPQSPAPLYNRQHSRGHIVTDQLDATVQRLQNLFPLRISNCGWVNRRHGYFVWPFSRANTQNCMCFCVNSWSFFFKFKKIFFFKVNRVSCTPISIQSPRILNTRRVTFWCSWLVNTISHSGSSLAAFLLNAFARSQRQLYTSTKSLAAAQGRCTWAV